jgi:RNA polymerase sigma factor (sigma-70 family)
MMTDDMQLVHDYARDGSEEAFATLVSRHVNLVYSVSLRQLRDPHLAEEVTQAAFIILARKAASLGPKTIVPAWLCRTVHYVAADALRTQRRRQKREQETSMQSSLNESDPGDSVWTSIAPQLDGALAGLREKDHNAIVLRFFEGRNLKQVGEAMGVSENAAKKRVHNALEKLRRYFFKRGTVISVAAIAGAITANSVQAAPPTLAKSIAAAAVSKGALASGSTLALIKGGLKLMAWAKLKSAALVAGAVVLLAAGGNELYALRQNSSAAASGVYIPKSAWANNGRSTPEDSIITTLWAKSIGDFKAFLAGAIPEMNRELENELLKNKSEQEKSAWAMESMRKVKGVTMKKKAALPDGSIPVELHIDGFPEAGYSIEVMTNINGEWKMAVAEEFYGSFYRFPILTDAECAARAGSDLQGFWKGYIKTGASGLHVSIKISEPYPNTFRADFYIEEQGSARQATVVSYQGKTVKLSPMGGGHGVFEGKLSNNGELVGNWSQGGRQIPMTFARAK